MRRRRMPRRPIRPRPVMRGPRGRRPIPPKLVEAHRLYDAGEYGPAGDLYLDLAEKALERGIPQAPHLFMRSAEARLKSGDPAQAQDLIKQGLGILIAQERWQRLKKIGRITIQQLKTEDQEEMAGQIQDWIEGQVPDRVRNSKDWRNAQAAGVSPAKLPATCGQCGGPVHPDDVAWFDEGSPVCSYCGAVLEV